MSNEAKTSKSVDPKYWFDLAVENFIIEGKSIRSSGFSILGDDNYSIIRIFTLSWQEQASSVRK